MCKGLKLSSISCGIEICRACTLTVPRKYIFSGKYNGDVNEVEAAVSGKTHLTFLSLFVVGELAQDNVRAELDRMNVALVSQQQHTIAKISIREKIGVNN